MGDTHSIDQRLKPPFAFPPSSPQPWGRKGVLCGAELTLLFFLRFLTCWYPSVDCEEVTETSLKVSSKAGHHFYRQP